MQLRIMESCDAFPRGFQGNLSGAITPHISMHMHSGTLSIAISDPPVAAVFFGNPFLT